MNIVLVYENRSGGFLYQCQCNYSKGKDHLPLNKLSNPNDLAFVMVGS